MSTRKFVVAGIDGGPDGLRAADYAAALATAEGRGLRLVHAYHIVAGLNPMYPYYGINDLRDAGADALAQAELRVRDRYSNLDVDHLLVLAPRAAALVDASKAASVVVVGRRAAHGIGRVLTGSTSTAVAARAATPVISVPGSWTPDRDAGPVVVGADGSDQGRNAISFAFTEASRRGAELLVLRVWEVPVLWHADIPVVDSAAREWAERAQLALAEDLAGWAEEFPEVRVTAHVERSPYVAEQLLNRSDDAGLLVIGSRGHTAIPGIDLGFTARSVLSHAACPVAVVHPGQPVDSRDRVRVHTATR